MRLRKQHSKTWGWAEAVAHSGETGAGLRRKLQREVLELTTSETGRTEVTLQDIAALRISRHLCDLGFEAKRAFGLAKVAVKKLFDEDDADQNLLYLVTNRSAGGSGGVRLLTVNPAKPEDVRELLLVLSGPLNVVVPVQSLVRDAWYSLPDLPDDVAKWLRSLSATIDALQSKAGD